VFKCQKGIRFPIETVPLRSWICRGCGCIP